MKVTVKDNIGLYIEQNVTCENFKTRGILNEMYSIFYSHPFNKYNQALFWYLRYISGQNTFISLGKTYKSKQYNRQENNIVIK